MNDSLLALSVIIGCFSLVLFRIPLAVALLLSGFAGMVCLTSWTAAITQLNIVVWEAAANPLFITIPMFIWMGQLASVSGAMQDIYRCSELWLRRSPFGLAYTALFTSAGFGVLSGSSVASVAGVAPIAMPAMQKSGYPTRLASGVVASSGVLSILIPPSIPLVIVGLWTETSIGDLFVAVIVPGLILLALYMLTIAVFFRESGKALMENRNAYEGVSPEDYSLRERLKALMVVVPFFSVAAFVLVLIYGGICSPIEAASIGALAVLCFGGVSKRLSMASVVLSLRRSGYISISLIFLLLGGMMFARFIAQSGMVEDILSWFEIAKYSPATIFLLIVLMYLLLGALIDSISMVMVSLPITYPLVLSLGYDPVWFGVFVVMMVELSLMTPPIGINVLTLKQTIPELSLKDIYLGCIPFLLVSLLLVCLLIVYPQMTALL